MSIAVIVALVGGLSGSGVAADVSFRYAILADAGNGMQPLDFSTMPIIHSGTPMQFYLEHLENCYIYLFLLDSGEQLAPLFPMAPGYYTYGFPRGQKYFPPGERTFTFVPPGGIETFILVATAERPFKLEKLADELLKNQGSRSQQQLVLDEIDALFQDREERSKKAEKTVRVERRTRVGETIDTVVFRATEVDISRLYGRRLQIDHR